MAQMVGYIRVSTPDQAGEDHYGPQAQREQIEGWAKANGHAVCGWYEDLGISGSTLARPGLMTMLDAVKVGGYAGVIVAKLDRIARDLMAQLWIEKELLKADTEMISVAESVRGQDPTSVLMRQIIGAFAEFERARITERMIGGRMAKARIGGYAGGGVPMGYRTEKGTKRIHVDPAKSETVQAVFGFRRAHPEWSLRKLAAAMDGAGYTTTEGKPFGPMQIKRILDRQAFYAGEYRYREIRTDGQHVAILDPAEA